MDSVKTFLQIHLIFIALLGSWLTDAQVEWKIVSTKNNQFAIENVKNKTIRHPIEGQNTTPRYMGLHRVKKQNIALLIYFSGSAGTGEVVDIYRTVIFNTKSKKFYGDFPFRVTSSLPGKSWPDTVFTFKDQSFTVVDANTNLKKIINY